MADRIEMSTRFIDRGEADGPMNRINRKLPDMDTDMPPPSAVAALADA